MQSNYFISFTDSGLIVNNADAFTERISDIYTVCLVDISRNTLTLKYRDNVQTFNMEGNNSHIVDRVIDILRDYIRNTDDEDILNFKFPSLFDENTSIMYTESSAGNPTDYTKYMNIFTEGNRYRDETRIVKINQDILDLRDNIGIINSNIQEQKNILTEFARGGLNTQDIIELKNNGDNLQEQLNVLNTRVDSLEERVNDQETSLTAFKSDTEGILKIMADSLRKTINVSRIIDNADELLY